MNVEHAVVVAIAIVGVELRAGEQPHVGGADAAAEAAAAAGQDRPHPVDREAAETSASNGLTSE